MATFDIREYGSTRVAAVIPARNEVQTIAQIVRAASAYVHEVIVMDGRSTDDTAKVAQLAGARVVSDMGRGKGAGMRQSFTETTADIIVFLDADGSHDPADIPALVRPIVAGEAELCVGSRFSGGTDELSVTFAQLVRTIGNVAMNIAINHRFNVRLTDTLNGFRAIRRTMALEVHLTENRHTIEQEMVMKVLAGGYAVANTPTHEYARLFGASHIAGWREWPTFVRCVFVNIFRTQKFRHIERPSHAATHTPSWMSRDAEVNVHGNAAMNGEQPSAL